MDAGEIDDQDDEDYEESMSARGADRKVWTSAIHCNSRHVLCDRSPSMSYIITRYPPKEETRGDSCRKTA